MKHILQVLAMQSNLERCTTYASVHVDSMLRTTSNLYNDAYFLGFGDQQLNTMGVNERFGDTFILYDISLLISFTESAIVCIISRVQY